MVTASPAGTVVVELEIGPSPQRFFRLRLE
jgi:hypothetical protein